MKIFLNTHSSMEQFNTHKLVSLLRHLDIYQNTFFHNKNESNYENIELKNAFKNASKTKSGKNGIPDATIILDKILVVIEVKPSNLIKAIRESKFYVENLNKNNFEEIYCCGFVSEIQNAFYQYENGIFTLINETFEEFFLKRRVKNSKKNYNINVMNKEISKLHNYIRDNTKITNDDKSLYTAGILLALNNPIFNKLITDNIQKTGLADQLLISLKGFGISLEYFSFITQSLDNEHLYAISKTLLDIYNKIPNEDILNLLYTEFVKYQNNDSSSLGIVLTPDYITEIMIRILNINEDDIFLDLCSGTGSFACKLLEGVKSKKIICCEFQGKLHALLNINMLIRNIDKEKYELYNADCFTKNFKATKSAINPPYSETVNTELTFILKQLESLKENGLCCAIVPLGCFNNNKKNNKNKKIIMEIGKVKQIIRCRDTLFNSSNVSIETCIILIEKNSKGQENSKVNCVDYRDDGLFSKMRSGFIKGDNYETKLTDLYRQIDDNTNLQTLEIESDWTDFGNDINHYLDDKVMKKFFYDMKYNEGLNIINQLPSTRISYDKEKTFLISDVFYILKKPKTPYQNLNSKVRNISACKFNFGITGLVDSSQYTFTKNKIVLVTGGNGGAGLAHYQNEDFNISSSTIVLQPKYDFLNEKNGIVISQILSNYKDKYSHSKQWSQERIKKDAVIFKINDLDKIDAVYYEELQEKYNN